MAQSFPAGIIEQLLIVIINLIVKVREKQGNVVVTYSFGKNCTMVVPDKYH